MFFLNLDDRLPKAVNDTAINIDLDGALNVFKIISRDRPNVGEGEKTFVNYGVRGHYRMAYVMHQATGLKCYQPIGPNYSVFPCRQYGIFRRSWLKGNIDGTIAQSINIPSDKTFTIPIFIIDDLDKNFDNTQARLLFHADGGSADDISTYRIHYHMPSISNNGSNYKMVLPINLVDPFEINAEGLPYFIVKEKADFMAPIVERGITCLPPKYAPYSYLTR